MMIDILAYLMLISLIALVVFSVMAVIAFTKRQPIKKRVIGAIISLVIATICVAGVSALY